MSTSQQIPKILYTIAGIAGIGGIRAFYKSGFVEISNYNYTEKAYIKRPLLYSERLLISGGGALMFLSPFMLMGVYRDIKRIEAYMRNLDSNIYDTKIKDELDVIF